MTNIAVILAGGTGKRFGAGLPKQLRTLDDGRTVLQTCIDAFRACPMIDDVLVVMHPDWINDVQGVQVVAGGKERWESSWHAIERLQDTGYRLQDVNILIHDAARPFVSRRIIEDVCHALETHEAVTVAVPATDTMYRVKTADADGIKTADAVGIKTATLVDIPDRTTMWRAQTPQAFRLNLIREAYERFLQPSPFEGESERVFTDDCGILHRYLPEVPIHIVEGEETNRKITYIEDL